MAPAPDDREYNVRKWGSVVHCIVGDHAGVHVSQCTISKFSPQSTKMPLYTGGIYIHVPVAKCVGF